jgi:hypothetical protein
MRRRRILLRYACRQFAFILVAAGVFGFNPYVTNTVHRGHPFYPWLGTAAYPSYAQRGRDPNERVETPKNTVGRSRLAQRSAAASQYLPRARIPALPSTRRGARNRVPFRRRLNELALAAPFSRDFHFGLSGTTSITPATVL